MLRFLSLLFIFALSGHTALAKDCPESLNFSFRTLAGETPTSLCENFNGKVLLVVNTASYCGFTPQYDGLEALYERYRDRGLAVLGFPSNDFAQEPGSEQEIASFCRLTYTIKFPMFEKINVTGAAAHPFYQSLAANGGGYPKWNFHKYLVDRDGNIVASFPARTKPQDAQLIEAIEKLL